MKIILSEATKYLVSDKTGGHLPYTNESGSPDARLMGAAWAALHGGYRGNKYEGPAKEAAITKLKGIYTSEKMQTPEESDRTLFEIGLAEAYDAAKGEITITVIKPGFNKSKGKFYPAEMLKRDHKVFEGAKMFADHATEAERRARPEGSVNNWVASLRNVAAEADGTVKGRAVVVDPQFKAKLDRLNEAGLLSEMGVSIRALGLGERKTIDGTSTISMESLNHALSVDFVTHAGAGGRVEAMESAALDESIENYFAVKESSDMDPKEIQALKDRLTVLEAENVTLKTAAQESAKQVRIAAAKTEVEKQLGESKLPKVAQDRIRKQFETSEATDKLADAIKSEADYIKSVGGNAVTNNGEGQNREVRESDPVKLKESQKIAYMRQGLTEAEAKLAAGIV